MAQADYVIDNAPGINVREDINTTFQAVVTGNSGQQEPNTKYPGMLWLDLSLVSKPDGVWRYRSQANDRWLPLIPPPDGVVVPNLNADMLDGLHATAFALKTEINNMVGSMTFFPASVAPTNYLKVNGAWLLRTVYPELFAFAQASGLMAATQAQRDANWALWGPGDGVNSFQLPDLRGAFLRVADEARGVDPGRGTGTTQGSAFASHGHSAVTDTQGWHGHTGFSDVVGNHEHPYDVPPPATDWDGQGASSGGSWLDLTKYQTRNTYGGGAHQHYLSIDGNGNHAHNVTVYANGSNETRPLNAAYPLFIRYR